ncbi:unnamed protein product [Paramecium primaurelia]|uniref:Uncharacterized protein n=1 Tax=Paramecium primaurelia TaxID=5886 RepID=A0A8S1KJT7_PARPR|nr:unnamed protein product [Paramecium primaurelia]
MKQKLYKWITLDDIEQGDISIYLQLYQQQPKNYGEWQTIQGTDILTKNKKQIELSYHQPIVNNSIYSIIGVAYYDDKDNCLKIIIEHLNELFDFDIELHQYTYEQIQKLTKQQ